MTGGSARLRLRVVAGSLAVARLAPDAAVPDWASNGQLQAVSRTGDELSIVCAERDVPETVHAERGFCALVVEGPLDFSLTGILAALTVPLAAAGVSVFAISTFDTDWLLVRETQIDTAIAALRASGRFDVSGDGRGRT